jgi:hypothetical protein
MQEYKVTVSNIKTEWRQNGKLHREDGPAVELITGYKRWYQNGFLHREDGPAIVFTNGNKEWWLNGRQYTESKFQSETQPAKELTVVQIEEILGHRIKIVK